MRSNKQNRLSITLFYYVTQFRNTIQVFRYLPCPWSKGLTSEGSGFEVWEWGVLGLFPPPSLLLLGSWNLFVLNQISQKDLQDVARSTGSPNTGQLGAAIRVVAQAGLDYHDDIIIKVPKRVP
jgi:hypothetical protein